MKIEKVVHSEITDQGSGYYLSDSLFLPSPRDHYDTMCTIRVQTSNFFKIGTISIILSAFENWKFKQSLTKMIARWVTWQDFPLKRKLISISV